MKNNRIIALLLIIMTMTNCSTASKQTTENSNTGTDQPNSISNYRKMRNANEIAPGYLIKLSNMEDEKINGSFRVEFDGIIKLPYKIEIQTSGLTLSALRDRIITAYRPFFKTHPDIQVTLVEKKYWVDVQGLVEKPGQFLVKNDASLDELIALAGGFQKTTDLSTNKANYVRIRQGDSTEVIKLSDYYTGSQGLIPEWQGGDLVFFQSEKGQTEYRDIVDTNYIQILGQVHTPGEYLYKKNADFYYYLGKSGGPTDRADFQKIERIRGSSGTRESVVFETEKPDQIPDLRGGDIVIVHAQRESTLQNTLSIASIVTGIVTSITVVILAFVK